MVVPGTEHRLGCSLPTRFVAGGEVLDDHSRDWVEMYGSRDVCLDVLEALGVSSIELRDVRADTDVAILERALQVLQERGLHPTLHLWLPNDPEDFVPLGRAVAATASAADGTVQCALHGLDLEAGRTRAEKVGETIRVLKRLCSSLATSGSPLRPALELCRAAEGGPIGTTFAELVSMFRSIAADNLGLCWDVGHGLADHEANGSPLLPDAEFTRLVTHTHIHSLDATGRTHGPLTGTGGPVAAFVRLLHRADYRGAFNLELEPARWPPGAEARRRCVDDSVVALRKMVEGTPA